MYVLTGSMACYLAGRHIYLANRGSIITPFHNMMLIPPVASDDAIGCLVEALGRLHG